MSKPLVILMILSSTSVVPFTAGQEPNPLTVTTPNASTHICKADEEWQLRNQQYGCFCKDPYKVTALSQVVPDLSCESFEMRAAFHKCQFNDLNIYFNQSHVKDTACLRFQDDPVTNTFSVLVPLKVGDCKALSYLSIPPTLLLLLPKIFLYLLICICESH
ncbi:uromodulin-like isoform X1 [Lithobates pipiens]